MRWGLSHKSYFFRIFPRSSKYFLIHAGEADFDGLTRAEVVNLATDYAVSLHLRERGKELTMKWYYNFIKRWPELHAVKPSSLSELRAKSASPACIKKYQVNNLCSCQAIPNLCHSFHMFHKKRFFFLTEEGRYSCLTTVNMNTPINTVS
jgi:hypothetical protein